MGTLGSDNATFGVSYVILFSIADASKSIYKPVISRSMLTLLSCSLRDVETSGRDLTVLFM